MSALRLYQWAVRRSVHPIAGQHSANLTDQRMSRAYETVICGQLKLPPAGSNPIPSRLVRRLFRNPAAGSNLEYRRFAVISQARCGTRMLVSALNGHSAVLCYDELYNPGHLGSPRGPALNVPGLRDRSRILKHYRNVFPVGFLKTLVFQGYQHGIEAVGFKLHASHLRYCRNRVLVDTLKCDARMRFIHLYRENKLKQRLSHALALRTGKFRSFLEPVRPEAIRLDPVRCENFFVQYAREEARLKSMFAGNRIYSVSYEQVVADVDREMKRVQRHLGLRVEVIRPTTRKQRRWPEQELIVNYAELESYFAGTQWEAYFSELH